MLAAVQASYLALTRTIENLISYNRVLEIVKALFTGNAGFFGL